MEQNQLFENVFV